MVLASNAGAISIAQAIKVSISAPLFHLKQKTKNFFIPFIEEKERAGKIL